MVTVVGVPYPVIGPKDGPPGTRAVQQSTEDKFACPPRDGPGPPTHNDDDSTLAARGGEEVGGAPDSLGTFLNLSPGKDGETRPAFAPSVQEGGCRLP